MKIYSDLPKTQTCKVYLLHIISKKPRTYTNGNETQCKPNTYRSFSDLFIICKTRFPKLSEKRLSRFLIELREKDNRVYFSFCEKIQKPVVQYRDSYMPRPYMDSNFKRVGEDNLSLEKIFQMAKDDRK